MPGAISAVTHDAVHLPTADAASPATAAAMTSSSHQGDASHIEVEQASAGHNHMYQLLLWPIVKATIAQRDSSAEALDDVVINGGSLQEIMQKAWSLFSSRVKCRAVRPDGKWSVETHDVAEWDRVMQFRAKKKVVESTKSEQAWRQWLLKTRGYTITLVINEYGLSVARAQDRDEFVAACIQPPETDRAGATAETSLRDVVQSLQEIWGGGGATFQASGVVWRMWANHLTRNLNRSTWDAAVLQPPPEYIANLLRPVDSQVEAHIAEVTLSANTALEVVLGSIADYKELHRTWEAFGRQLQENER
ncbi:hypothetical protein GQ600_11383 [Phytophthora cactorum]|nr:hypothetical protein GQ600_11383 [Phytophthora cactorum]